MPKLDKKITKTVVEKLPFPEKGQVLYFDREMKGFGVRVTPTKKSYFVQRDVEGKSVRQTIGTHNPWTAEKARKKAGKLLVALGKGKDPRKKRKKKRAKAVAKSLTLEQAFAEYAKKKSLAPKTEKDYRLCLKKLGVPRVCWPKRGQREEKWEHADKGWWLKPVSKISKTMVAEEHQRLGEKSGEQYANLAMRTLRAVFNYLSQAYEDEAENSFFPINPVSRLTKTDAWYDDRERDTWVHWDQFPTFWKTINGFVEGVSDRSEFEWSVRDYLLFVMIYGTRKNEMMKLRWDEVNLERGSLHIPGMRTKNGKPLYLPLPDFHHELLVERAKYRDCDWVFPGKKYKTKKRNHMVEPRNYVSVLADELGFDFSLHDMRRTFVNAANKLRVSVFDIKEIVNHKAKSKRQSDITFSYSVTDPEELREPLQDICDFYVEKMGVEAGGR